MRKQLLMNTGWKYYFGEPDFKAPKYTTSDMQYRGSRAENGRGPARRDFDDSAWRTVDLPHDFVAENGVSETAPFGGEHYDFPQDRGSAWYRRYFRLEEEDKNQHLVLHFEAVATVCEVYVNSILLKTHRTAGIGFYVDITDVARFGGEINVVSVHVDDHDYEAWYVEGGGITRNVWLIKTPFVHLVSDSMNVTPSANNDFSVWEALTSAEVADNGQDRRVTTPYTVRFTAYRADGTVFDVGEVKNEIMPGQVHEEKAALTCKQPELWDTEHPVLYRAAVELYLGEDKEPADRLEVRFGFRTFSWDKNNFYVNGKSVKIYGFANHMNYLGVGEAMSDSMRELHIRRLKEMGGNGFRTAHSPFGNAIYDYCDEYGLLVLDENRIFHSSEIVLEDVANWVRRDRHHASVAMWSMFNEEDLMTRETGRRIFRHMAQVVRSLDTVRPITGAISYGVFSEHSQDDFDMDILGYNHETAYFEKLHGFKNYDNKPFLCTEEVMPVGDDPAWQAGLKAGLDYTLTNKLPYFIGGYHFTAWRYGAEKGQIVDGLGRKCEGFWGYTALLCKEPCAKIMPGWTFDKKPGETVRLNLANNGDSVRLYVNGRFVEEIPTNLLNITPYELPYEPGTVKIEAMKDGKIWATDEVKTAGAPASIRLEMENPKLNADGYDVALISAWLVDENGTVCDTAIGYPTNFACNAAGKFVSSASIRPEDDWMGFCGETVKFYNGHCQVYYRSEAVEGDLVVTASCKGLPTASLSIARQPVAAKPAVEEIESPYILDWRVSKVRIGERPEDEDEKIRIARQIERWEKVDTLGSADVLYGLNKIYPAGTVYGYTELGQCKMPVVSGEKGDKHLILHFEGIDGPAHIVVINADKDTRVDAQTNGNAPWDGHYRSELMVDCEALQAKPGDSIEIWVFFNHIHRVHGVTWPVSWTYELPATIKALDAQTLREWDTANGLR